MRPRSTPSLLLSLPLPVLVLLLVRAPPPLLPTPPHVGWWQCQLVRKPLAALEGVLQDVMEAEAARAEEEGGCDASRPRRITRGGGASASPVGALVASTTAEGAGGRRRRALKEGGGGAGEERGAVGV